MKRIILLSAIALSLTACDKIDEPLKDGFGFIELPETNKTLLIEEFTGVQCTFCPDGARKIKGYIQAAPENVLTVAIHASAFATPYPGETSLSTAEGEDFYKFMGSGGLPGGLFDRADFPNEVFKNPALWDGLLQDRLALPAEFNITGELKYDANDSTFTLRTSVLGLADLDGEAINLTTYLLEDSILTTQLDKGVNVLNYVQEHVFRSSFAGMSGEQISTGVVAKDQIFTKTYSLKVDPSKFRIEKCSAVMFVYTPANQEILQAGHADLE